MNKLDTLPKKKILSLFMTCGFPTLNQSKKIFNEILSNQHFFEGDRNQVRAQSAETAIKDTINFLKNID